MPIEEKDLPKAREKAAGLIKEFLDSLNQSAEFKDQIEKIDIKNTGRIGEAGKTMTTNIKPVDDADAGPVVILYNKPNSKVRQEVLDFFKGFEAAHKRPSHQRLSPGTAVPQYFSFENQHLEKLITHLSEKTYKPAEESKLKI